MGRSRSKATPEDVSVAFHTDEGFKRVAARLGMSPNTLRKKWKGEFGEEAFKARGKTIQARVAAVHAKGIATSRVYKDAEVVCTTCGAEVTLKTNQVAQMDGGTYRCPTCLGDRDCPVCGQRVDGERGLSGHFRHRREAGDKAHTDYEKEQEESRWAGKSEPEDYVTCRECGLRSRGLTGHIRIHGLMAAGYQAKHPGSHLRCRETMVSVQKGVSRSHTRGEHTGTKAIQCPECDLEYLVPKQFAPSVHDSRCAICKALDTIIEEELGWEGLTEPEDYVWCQVSGCSYRSENLTSHLQSRHPDLVGRYPKVYPRALINAERSGSRMRGSNRALNLTRADLVPHMDEKGRVIVSWAAEKIGCVSWTVLRYCRELGIPTRNRLAFQKRVLDAIKGILEEPYRWEQSWSEIVNPETGYRLYFDGYFPGRNLVVEAHGKQHYEFVPYWHKTEANFERRQQLDALKAQRLQEKGIGLVIVRYDEPYEDVMYLRGRLHELGL